MEKVRTRRDDGNEDDAAVCQIRAWLLVVVRHECNPPDAQAAFFRQSSLLNKTFRILANVCGYRFVPATNRIFQSLVIGNMQRLQVRSKRTVGLVTGLLPVQAFASRTSPDYRRPPGFAPNCDAAYEALRRG